MDDETLRDGQIGLEGTRERPEQQEAEAGSAARDDAAFDQVLADEAPAGGAECGADGRFLRACRAPGQREIGEIGARDDQDGGNREEDRRSERVDTIRIATCRDAVLQQPSATMRTTRAVIRRLDWERRVEPLRDHGDVRGRLRDRDAWLQPSPQDQRAERPIRKLAFRPSGASPIRNGGVGNPDRSRQNDRNTVEWAADDADDLKRLARDRDRPAEYRGISVQSRAPEGVRNDGDPGAGRLVVRLQDAAQPRCDAERREIIAADALTEHGLND